jgi:hypothetical protein
MVTDLRVEVVVKCKGYLYGEYTVVNDHLLGTYMPHKEDKDCKLQWETVPTKFGDYGTSSVGNYYGTIKLYSIQTHDVKEKATDEEKAELKAKNTIEHLNFKFEFEIAEDW